MNVTFGSGIAPQLVALLLAALSLTGCDAERQSQLIEMPLPERIRNIEALGEVSAIAVVNGVQTNMQAVSGGFLATVQVPVGSTSSIAIEYREAFEGELLTLASYSGSVTVADQSSRLELRRSLFNYDAHDDDGDSVNNLVEREQETNPRDANDAPDMVTVSVQADRPQALLQSSFTSFFVEGTVAGLTRRLQPSGNNFAGNFRVPVALPVEARVDVIESSTGESLNIASQQRTLNSLFDQLQIQFDAGGYDTTADRDGDGQSDLTELIAGADPLVADGGASIATLNIEFSIPGEIDNRAQASGQLLVNGGDRSAALIRNGDTFSAAIDTVVAQSTVISVSVLDVFNNQPYPLAQGTRTISTVAGAQNVSFGSADLLLNLDADQDGVANYLERERGTNPFVADAGPTVECTASGLPALSAAPGQVAVLSVISSYIDCSGEPYALSSADSGFAWDEAADTVRWSVPGNTVADSIEVTLNIVNPADPGQLYGSAELTILVDQSGCSVTEQQLTLQPIRDAYIDGSQLVNSGLLRIDASGRQSLMTFSLDPALGSAALATLSLTVASDAGEGQISLFAVSDFQWAETDNVVVLPQELDAGNLVGSTSSAEVWDIGVRYQLGLSAERLGTGEVTLVARMEGDVNDVAFESTESSNGPALALSYAACP